MLVYVRVCSKRDEVKVRVPISRTRFTATVRIKVIRFTDDIIVRESIVTLLFLFLTLGDSLAPTSCSEIRFTRDIRDNIFSYLWRNSQILLFSISQKEPIESWNSLVISFAMWERICIRSSQSKEVSENFKFYLRYNA